MKTNYAKIDMAVARVERARVKYNRVASQRIGVISGGPSIETETVELETAINELVDLTRQAVKNGCRKRTLLEHLNGELVSTDIAKDLFQEIEFCRELNKQ